MSEVTTPYLGKYPVRVNISNSEIQTFKKCRRKWYFEYYLGRTIERSGIGPLPLGIRVHSAFEAHYKEDEPLLDAYLRLYAEDKERFDASKEGFFEDKQKAFASEGELGRVMIEGYLEWMDDTAGLADYRITDVENALQYEMLDGRVNLIGKVDIELEHQNTGHRHIGDFKTAAALTEYVNTSHMSEQLMLYTMLRRLTHETRTDGGVYIILKKVKRTAKAAPPFYEKMIIDFNDKTIASFWERITGTLEDMIQTRDRLDAGEDHRKVAYPSVSRDCQWYCEFKAVCSMVDDGSDWERWLETQSHPHNPYERYGDQLTN